MRSSCVVLCCGVLSSEELQCYAPLCLCGALLYCMRLQLHHGGRGKPPSWPMSKSRLHCRHTLGYESDDHGSLPWPLRCGVPRTARREDRVNLVLECGKELVPPFSLSPATSKAAAVRAMHLRIRVPCAAASGDGVRLRPSIVAARPPLIRPAGIEADTNQGETMGFSARISSPHFVTVSCPAFSVSTVPCSVAYPVPHYFQGAVAGAMPSTRQPHVRLQAAASGKNKPQVFGLFAGDAAHHG